MIWRIQELVDRLQGLAPNQRQIGKTRMAVELTKRVGGVLLCSHQDEARRVGQEHDVPAYGILSVDVRGRWEPIIVDQDAFCVVVNALLDTIRDQSAKLAKLEQIREILGDD